jgi:AcrR family transcriptional regulator
MGRRSLHTADELRELILDASTELIKEQGLGGLSAREIARRINYSPGTLYNSFENLDDLVLTIEGRLLDRLSEALAALPAEGDPRRRVHILAERYLQFASENPKLWNLLFEHHVPQSQVVPEWYRNKLEALMRKVEAALSPLADGLDRDDLQRAARVLWASVHGLSSLSAADKLSIITSDDAASLMDDLVGTYLSGLEARSGPGGP